MNFIYLLLCVDDMLISSKYMVKIEKLKDQLSNKFDMKYLGEVKRILGMEIIRDRGKGRVHLSQTAYMKKVLQKFGIGTNSKSVSTPLAFHFNLSAQLCPKSLEERDQIKKVPYASVMGILMYAWYVHVQIFPKLLVSPVVICMIQENNIEKL